MIRRLMIVSAALAWAFVSTARAQPPSDTAVTFGNKLSVATISSALQAAGYQALVARPPGLPEVVLGVITTGVGGAKISVLVTKCENVKTDDVCALTFLATFTDDKNVLGDAMLAAINQKTIFAKATRVIRTIDNKPMLNVAYSYVVKDFDDTKFIVPVMASFAQDIGRAVQVYNAPPAAPTPAK